MPILAAWALAVAIGKQRQKRSARQLLPSPPEALVETLAFCVNHDPSVDHDGKDCPSEGPARQELPSLKRGKSNNNAYISMSYKVRFGARIASLRAAKCLRLSKRRRIINEGPMICR